MIYAYIFVMAGVTYLIRMLPLTLIQKKIPGPAARCGRRSAAHRFPQRENG